MIIQQNELSQLISYSTAKFKNIYVLKSLSGCCNQLHDNSCSIYTIRPRGCCEYPWYNINGELYFDIGCPGMRHDKDERPDVRNITSINQYLPVTSFDRILMIALFKIW